MSLKPAAAIILASSLAFSAQARTPAETAQSMMQAVFVNFDANAAKALIAKDYIQHNPSIPTGRAPIIGFIPALKESGISLTNHRIFAEGNHVVMHNSYTHAQALGAEKLVSFDVFRIENGVVAEHWDNIAEMTPPNPSGHSQTDGPVVVTDLDRTADNRKLVTDFVETILVKGDMSRLAGFFDGDRYIQHNSQIGDGLSGLGTALAALAEQGITMKYDTVHRVIAQGNFVFTMSEGSFGGRPTAFFDLFRVENGKIAEHWDVISAIPSEMAHENGKF